MPMNRVQFQKGLAMPEFLALYGTEQQCEQALVAARWPSGFACPVCGVMESRTTFRRQGRLYFQCSGCQHQCSATSGTVFGSTKLPLTLWFLAMQLLTQSKNMYGRPRLAKRSFHDGSKVKIAVMYPDSDVRLTPAVPDGIRWLAPSSTSRALFALCSCQALPTPV